MATADSLRVLHIVEATTAGVARHVLDLSRDMRQAGIDVTVACPHVRQVARQDTAFVEQLSAAGLSVVLVPMRRSIRPLADLRAYLRLLRLIRREGYDVVHTHSSKAGVLGRLAAGRAGVAAIVYTPNGFAFRAKNRLLSGLYRAVERWLGHRTTDALICVSPSELALAQREAIAPPERLVLIENAIDASLFAPPGDARLAKTALGLDPDPPLLGFVGRLDRHKGVEIFVEAARLVVSTQGDARFVLVGEGELENALRRAVRKHHLERHVVLAGYRTDIPLVLQALDVFVLPSLFEALPYTLMEAMAAGKAVITTNVMGNCDLVEQGQTGLLVPPCDARALAEAMIRLLSAPAERHRLGRQALAAAQSRPTPAQMARQVADLYLTILQRKRKAL